MKVLVDSIEKGLGRRLRRISDECEYFVGCPHLLEEIIDEIVIVVDDIDVLALLFAAFIFLAREHHFKIGNHAVPE